MYLVLNQHDALLRFDEKDYEERENDYKKFTSQHKVKYDFPSKFEFNGILKDSIIFHFPFSYSLFTTHIDYLPLKSTFITFPSGSFSKVNRTRLMQ